MIFTLTRRLILCVPVLLLLVISSCSLDPNARKEKYFRSGQHYFAEGKYREAAIEFGNAIKIDPKYAEAHQELAETYLHLKQGEGAGQEFIRTLDLQPENYQARIELTNLLILAHAFQDAHDQIDLLLQKRPNDPDVHLAISNLLEAQEDVPGSISEVQKAIALAPSRQDLYLRVAILQMRTSQPNLAEASLKKVIELNPASSQAHVLLGTFYQSSNRLDDAEQEFRKAIQFDPRNPEGTAALSRLYLAEGKKAEAEALVKQTQRDLTNNPAGYSMLGDFYMLTGATDKAVAEYANLHLQHPGDLNVTKTYIQLLVQEKRFPEARALNDTILKANPDDDDAMVYQAEMQISDGAVGDAAQKLEVLIKNSPKNAKAHYALGIAYDKLGYAERAESEWREALQLQPTMIDAVRALASSAMRQGDSATLEQASAQLIVLQPSSPDGYALRALASINRKHYGEAQQDINRAIAVAPQSAFGYVQLGNLKLVQKEFGDATKAFQQALDRNPNSSDALRGLVNAFVAENQLDNAIAAVRAQIAKSPANSGFYDLLGSTLFFSKKDLSGAEAAFTKAIDLDKHNSDAMLKLCQVQATNGELDRAIASAQQGIGNNPRNPDLYILLGRFYESKSDWNQAQAAYRNALNISPQQPQASNNLARIMVQTGGNLDVALSLAQTARRGMPNSPSAADTLAWINYQKDAYQSAIGLLLEALSLQQKARMPDSSEIHFHLGMAYAKNGQTALARQQLERALKLDPNATEARKQLAGLKSL